MTGIITFRHVAAHPLLVARAFGPRVLARCLLAVLLRRRATFLALALAR